MSMEVDQIYLSMQSPATGEYLTANVYTIPGVEEADGSPRLLSIGQLVMALCLRRAAELESDIIKKMNTLENTTEQLERMTTIETSILNGSVNMKSLKVKYRGVEYTYYDFLTANDKSIDLTLNMENVPDTVDASNTQFLTDLEATMDAKNSFSQQTMIELQSQTTKRDQAYDMVSNILKSLNTVLIGNANNM